METVNKAGNELLESSAGDDASSLRSRLETMNQCWESVLQKTEEREQQLQSTLQQVHAPSTLAPCGAVHMTFGRKCISADERKAVWCRTVCLERKVNSVLELVWKEQLLITSFFLD